MKKTLALVLSLLVAFSMFSVMAAAADQVTVKFIYETEDDSEVIATVIVAPGTQIKPDDVPQIPTEFKADKDGKTYKYTFKGWKSSVDGEIYYASGIPTPDGSKATVVYTAEYAVEDYSERQSFWNLVESIFERINLLFEYFATVFNF